MRYDDSIQRVLTLIEQSEYMPTLEDMAQVAHLSKFHFLRIFKKQMGITPEQYVRMRRLVQASLQLRLTKRPILVIALEAEFQSQAAFTRAFKHQFALTPKQYRQHFTVLLQKERKIMTTITGWLLSGSNPADYAITLDHKIVHGGMRSAKLYSITATNETFATLMQQCKATNYLNKRIRLSAFVKAENVSSFAGLWMRIDNAQGEVLQFDNMYERPITGTRDWNYYSIVLDVPNHATAISFGILLQGTGIVWMDGIKFEEVDDNVPTTAVDLVGEINEAPQNLDFEQ